MLKKPHFFFFYIYSAIAAVILVALVLLVKSLQFKVTLPAYSDLADTEMVKTARAEQKHFERLASSTTALSPRYHIHFGILMYHHIDHDPTRKAGRLSVTPENLDQQIKFLLEQGYHFITLDKAFDLFSSPAAMAPDKTLVLTFDDGYRSFYVGAYPILKKYQVPASLYVITHDVGKPGNVTWAMLQEMLASGLVEIGAHTAHHKNLAHLPPPSARFELLRSKLQLEQTLGIHVTTAAYPYGSYTAATKAVAASLGFKGVAGIFSGERPRAGNQFAWRRVMITNNELGLNLLKKIYLAFEVIK